MHISLAGPSDLGDIASLYAEAGYGAPVAPADTILVATSGRQLVGVVRLRSEEGVTVLRGMQVKTAYQRQGIGALLLKACVPYLDRGPAFCLPYSHLDRFYGAAGFELVDRAALPDFLARRLDSYRAKGQDVIPMQRMR